MTIEEQYLPVTHKLKNCPICHNKALIMDVTPAYTVWDRLVVSTNSINATFRIVLGKRIEVREIK
jgi:hypothetical protein